MIHLAFELSVCCDNMVAAGVNTIAGRPDESEKAW